MGSTGLAGSTLGGESGSTNARGGGGDLCLCSGVPGGLLKWVLCEDSMSALFAYRRWAVAAVNVVRSVKPMSQTLTSFSC